MRRWSPLESPRAFARTCVQLAVALAILGVAGLVDPWFVLPLAGLLIAFAALTWLAALDVFDDPVTAIEEPGPDIEQVDDVSSPGASMAPRIATPRRPAAPGAAVAVAPSPAAELAPPVPDGAVLDGPVPSARTVRTFRLPASVGAERVALVGDFNGWSDTAHPMRRDGGSFTVDVELEAGRTYRYRYLLDGVRWENDWAADAYAPNDFGTDDSIAHT